MNWLKHPANSVRRSASLIGVVLLVLGCSPASPQSGPSGEAKVPATSGPKVIKFANTDEWPFAVQYGRVAGSSGDQERWFMMHANLTIFDPSANPVAQLAQKIPTVEGGDWKINPDGTMEVTWKIRPNVVWHDGSPLTAADFVLGYEVIMDPGLTPELGRSNIGKISAVRAVDPQTLVFSWSAPWIYGNANNIDGIPALNKSQIEPLYRSSDPAAFEGSQVWRSEFVGLGPFRLTQWVLGSYLILEAFDQFHLGRPKIDRVEFHWVADNVVVAQMLAGAIDVIPVDAHVKPEELTQIRQRMGPNWGTALSDRSTLRSLFLNLREGALEAGAKPPWAQDVRFRQAMMHSMNKTAIADAWGGSLVELIYYYVAPEEPVFKLAEDRAVPKYVFDPTKAAQLFGQAGWAKGPDGLLRNGAGATVDFPCCRYANAGVENVRESLIWGEDLKKAGLSVQHPIPPIPAGLSGTEGRKAQAFGWGGKISHLYWHISQQYSSLVSNEGPSDANRWSGRNSGSYSSAAFDSLVADRLTTVPLPARREKEFQLVKTLAEDLPLLPMYFNPSLIMAREGITGLSNPYPVTGPFTINIHEWDIK